jgi:integrase
LEVNDVTVNWAKIERPTTCSSEERDRAPTPEELRRILSHCTRLKYRLVILMASSSGLRIGTLLGLKVGDVSFEYPDVGRITVKRQMGRKFGSRRSVGGDRNMYVSWITPEARTCLEEYLRFRKANGEAVTVDSWLIGSDANPGHQMSISGWQNRYHEILKKAGLNTKGGRYYELHTHLGSISGAGASV